MEPVSVSDLLVAIVSGALLVLCGALYALAYAFGRLLGKRVLMLLAYAAFAALAACAYVLVDAMHLTGAWQALAIVLLAGYLFAPRWIWRLTAATHGHEVAHQVDPTVDSRGDA